MNLLPPVAVLLALQIGGPVEVRWPERLQNVFSADATETSEWEWSVAWFGGGQDGLLEHVVTRTDGPSTWETNLGAEGAQHRKFFISSNGALAMPGIMTSAEDMASFGYQGIATGINAGVWNSLSQDGTTWQLNASSPVSGFAAPQEHPSARSPLNLRALGLQVRSAEEYSANPFGLTESQLQGFGTAEFLEQRMGPSKWAVRAQFAGKTLEWILDDEKGGMPVRAEFRSTDGLSHYSITNYKKSEQGWVPDSTDFYAGDSANPYKSIEVHKATFNEPWHMRQFSIADTGAVNGTTFSSPDGKQRVWNGFELIDSETFWDEAYLAGELADPRILQVQAQQAGMSYEQFVESHRQHSQRLQEQYFRKHGTRPWLDRVPDDEWEDLLFGKKRGKQPDPWDQYAEKFLKENKLPQAGVDRAKETLKRAKQVRDGFRRKNAASLREARKENDERKLENFRKREDEMFKRLLVQPLNRLVHSKPKSSGDAPGTDLSPSP